MEQTAAQACPVCGNPADLYDVVDFGLNTRCFNKIMSARQEPDFSEGS